MGNIVNGIYLVSPNNIITGNLISGNNVDGIRVENGVDYEVSGNVITGNKVGTDANGNPTLGNTYYGISVFDASNNTIGGPDAGDGNMIAANGGAGVMIYKYQDPTIGNKVQNNLIWNNGGIGIDLRGTSGVTQNDAGDGDSGPNNLQNFPVLNTAYVSGAATIVTGTLNSSANTAYHIEFFSNPACDSSGYGEGQTYLGSADVTTNSSGNADFGVSLGAVTLGHAVSAVAIDPDGNTSEFSACTTATTRPIPTGPFTITYTYDPLYRLTAAGYSTGEFYRYTYDAVGNRLTQESTNLPSAVTYIYDEANRLTSVNGVNYTWDENGNLLNDGVNEYTYDSANRLIAVSGEQGVESSYTYNGLGDRLIADGVHYTLDLNTGLTQVLSDGTNTYLYGNGRIVQQNANSAEYFLGDALGSVRQLVNANTDVTLAKSYDPYGNVVYSAGSGTSPFAYAGEATDASGLTYLRARFYNPADGRFQSRDTWGGNENRPLSFNRWNYVEGNPANLTDPSGHFSPFWCQVMPNKGLYEACVDLHYGIEPMNLLRMGEYVTGSQGCYSGPTEYRAGGYIEGTSLTLALPMFSNWLFAFESVYDFATMQQSMFINENFGITGFPGIGLSDFVFGIVGAEYAGHAYGFLTNTRIISDYPGPVINFYWGGSIGLPFANDTLGVGAGIGTTLFVSPQPPYVRGNSVYVSFWAGADFAPYIDAGIGTLRMKPVNGSSVDSYVVNGDVQTARLYTDILFGRHNGWLTHTIPFLPLGMDLNLDWASRVLAANFALRYAEAYEELRQ